jgi:hypothetical protein
VIAAAKCSLPAFSLHAHPEFIVSDTYVNLRLRPELWISFMIDVTKCCFIGFQSLFEPEFECEKLSLKQPGLDGIFNGFL